ncbi:SRPBCC family protein [Streptomyces odontomachi]|uniref:SRPBCC family protein n=1 Tax=Streptomyces odontomachi TaxID=2944940 RepID=UPI00210B08F3|nr:SRPBCC family protein [Streptomyces sp. ODS25]
MTPTSDPSDSDHSVLHSTFTLERRYPAPPSRVFAAWSDPAEKATWFAGAGVEHALDFRVGGRETVHCRRRPDAGPDLAVVSVYQHIDPDERIVYTSTLSADDELATVSLTTVEFSAEGDGTRLVLTEQGTFLDGREHPDWREQGTAEWLTALATVFDAPAHT